MTDIAHLANENELPVRPEQSEKTIYFGSKTSPRDENDLSTSIPDQYLGPHSDNPWMMDEEDRAEYRRIVNPW